MQIGDKHYRYQEGYNEHDNYVELITYVITKKTPAGYWIQKNVFFGNFVIDKRWVSKNSLKRYAYPTKKEALAGFKARKAKHLKILTARMNYIASICKISEKLTAQEEDDTCTYASISTVPW